jgi:predicted nucleic acid-binding protein
MVHAELALDSGRPGAKALTGAFAAGWVKIQPVVDTRAVVELTRLLDPGEAEAILLAAQENARFLLIDDAKGRRVARERGLPVVGVVGVLLSAKSRGSLAAVGPVLEGLARVGYRLSPRLVAAVLERVGE